MADAHQVARTPDREVQTGPQNALRCSSVAPTSKRSLILLTRGSLDYQTGDDGNYISTWEEPVPQWLFMSTTQPQTVTVSEDQNYVLLVQWSEFLAANPEVPGSIPGATRFSE
jgi:hypothetical protein